MSTNKTTTTPNNIQSKKNLKAMSNVKHIHQFFTAHFIAIFLIIVVGLSSILFFLTLQHNHSQTKITAQFDSLQTQFLQQKYLMNADIVIDSILKSANSHELLTLQQALSLQSKKLSLLESEYKDSYQGAFSRNNLAMDLITRIESNDVQNELLKSKSLIQLDTLLDAIEIRLNDQQTSLKQAGLLYDVENQLTNIVVMLKDLNLKTSLVTFEKLNKKMDEVFVTDYARQLANQQDESQGMADIVRDFIRFEDLILKEDLLAKWQDNLYLIGDYQQQLVEAQQLLQSIMSELLVSQHGVDSVLVKNDYDTINIGKIDFVLFTKIPKWVGISSATLLICVGGLLWLARRKIKAISQFNVDSISRVIADEPSVLIVDENDSVSPSYKHTLYNAESEHLIRKIQLINSSKAEYLALIDKNYKLEEKIVKLKTSVKTTSQLRLEQQECESLHLAALKQLVLLSNIAIQETNNKIDVGEATNYLYQAHLEGRYLVRKLKRTSNYRYLQNSAALLKLSDENFIAQIQAIMLNLRSELLLCKNTISVTIDEKILPEVNLDVELFCEMFAAFVSLLLSQQKDKKLALKLQLVDKNKGQQTISFTGRVEGGENAVQLPHALQAFSDSSLDHSELGDYFNTLIKLQHGDDVSAKLTEKSYDFSFTLPLAISNNQQEHHFPVLSLPGREVDIQKDCAKLSAKYLVMPIEVLMAVKAPEKYQRLQQLLQGMGLQVTFVSSGLRLQQYWQSGRFTILITEVDCQPFTGLKVDKEEISSTRVLLTRGVFSLSDAIDSSTKPEYCSHWILGELNAKSTVSELVTALQPWIKEQGCENLIIEEKVPQVTRSIVDIDTLPEEQFAITSTNEEYSFNFERYLKHQGSAELAIFMLDEYTAENILLVKELSQAVMIHDGKKADDVIQVLLVNARILAAENLLHLCQEWHTLLTTQGLDSCEKLQMVLLSKTQQAVDEISQHAAAIA